MPKCFTTTMPNGWVYCMTNSSMLNIVKIGFTNDLDRRLKEANAHNTFRPPQPYKYEFAKLVVDHTVKEKKLHIILGNKRINPRKEFFESSVEKIRQLFDLIDGEYYEFENKNRQSTEHMEKYNITENALEDNALEDEYTQFSKWVNDYCIIDGDGKVSLRELTEKSGLSENEIKCFMKQLGHRYLPFRFPSDENGNYDQGGYKGVELLHFTEKCKIMGRFAI